MTGPWEPCQYEAFTNGQPHDRQLSRQSWAWIQAWIAQSVKLNTADAVDAALVFMAIHALGKIPEFRDELAPGFDSRRHDIALATILRGKPQGPQVVPSFWRLSNKYQKLIVDSLSVDFQFSQFLHAETIPSNLVVVKEKLLPHGDEGFAFFCFRVFAQLCGKMGSKSLRGSLFMDEPQFQRFRPGLETLQQLKTLEAPAAYNAFLLLRGSKAMSRFASPEHQALARLLCLGEAYDGDDGRSVCDAFDELSPGERKALTRFLNADSVCGAGRPGYVLCHASDFLQQARQNSNVGLVAALRMLLFVLVGCDSLVPATLGSARSALPWRPPSSPPFAKKSDIDVVSVNLGALAIWAGEAGPGPTAFLQASVSLREERLGETTVVTVEVERPFNFGGHPLSWEANSSGKNGWCPVS